MSARRRIASAGAVLLVLLFLGSATTTTEPVEDVAATAPPEVAVIIATPEPPPPKPEPEITPPPFRYAGIEISDADVETLARLVWLEARGEPFEGQVAVVEVVLNRILSPSFPDTVEAVVYQRDPVQFSPAALIPTTTPDEEQYRAVEEAITAAEPFTDADVVYFSTGPQNSRVFATIGAHVFCRE